MIPGLELINDAVSVEYAEQIVELLPPILVHGPPDEQVTSDAQKTSSTTGQAVGSGLQAHYFRPVPDFVSFVDEDAIPEDWKQSVWRQDDDNGPSGSCDCAIVQRYDPGQGIRPHVDLHRFDDGVAILSLLSGCVMDLYRGEAPEPEYKIYLPPRSLLLMRGEARYDWRHGTLSTTKDEINQDVTNWQALPTDLADRVSAGQTVVVERSRRISITMRKMGPSDT